MPRRLGQHFLRDQAILTRIADAVAPLAPEREPLIYEIGPGRGALTRLLVERCDRLIAIELDTQLIAPLQVSFPQIEVVECDVLRYPFAAGTGVICGNLPYYITSPIVEHVLALGAAHKHSVFLVQKEVAERLAAKHGSRDYGYLSVITQLAGDVELLFTVPPGAFSPPPQVDSAVVRITPRAGASVSAEFRKFIGCCFQLKRKTLRNNLRQLYPKIEGHADAGLRAEQIPVTRFPALFAELTA